MEKATEEDRYRTANFLFRWFARLSIFVIFYGFCEGLNLQTESLNALSLTLWIVATILLGYTLFNSFYMIPTLIKRKKK